MGNLSVAVRQIYALVMVYVEEAMVNDCVIYVRAWPFLLGLAPQRWLQPWCSDDPFLCPNTAQTSSELAHYYLNTILYRFPH